MLLNSLNSYIGFYNKYKESYDNINEEYFESLIMEYNDDYSNFPLLQYLQKLKKLGYKITLDDLKLIKEISNISSLEDRLKYGAKVTSEEVESIRQKILKF